jgi:hypothetical protein
LISWHRIESGADMREQEIKSRQDYHGGSHFRFC